MKLIRTPFLLTLFCFLLPLSSMSHASISKSANDKRHYLGLTLPNKLKVLLISDPDTPKAAAALDVDVGSNANPKDRAGLAHFLEHMLFLGTEKYPEAGEYQAFIRSHGGNHNAYTSYQNTNYFFDVGADSLEPALDRFSQFFVAPLFSEEYVDRERHAVHSEYQSKLRDDGRRIHEATKVATNPDHSYSRFAVGSLETLADRPNDLVRDDLIQFYNQYYSANLMTLVVLGKEPIEELKKMVEERFSSISNKQVERINDPEPLFEEDSLPAQLTVKSLKDLRNMSMTFPVEAVRDYWHKKPLYYIASMIGYEGEGSLLAELKQRGWATSLGAFTSNDLNNGATFKVSMSLTELGMAHQQEILQLFFTKVEMLSQRGVRSDLYAEQQQMGTVKFEFLEKSEPIHYVGQLASQLQHIPVEKVLEAPYLFEQFDKALINNYLSQLTPDNMLITLVSDQQQTDQTSKYFKTPYSLEPLSTESLGYMSKPAKEHTLAVRTANPFIAEDLALKPMISQLDKPTQIINQPGLQLWHQQDADFELPKSNFYFSILSSAANASARNTVLTALYTRLVEDQLNETLYDAAMAGLATNIYPHLQGLSVRLTGYNDKQDLLLDKVLKQMKAPLLREDRFAIIHQQYTENLQNSLKEKPFNQTISKIMQLLLPQWNTEQKLKALEQISLHDLQQFIPTLYHETKLRVLAHGNLQPTEAKEMAQQVRVALQNGATLDQQNAKLQVVQLRKDSQLVQTLPIEHNDSAISVYFQGSDTQTKTRAQFALLSEIVSSPFYTKLRTEQQLGYVVFQTPLPLRNAPGLAFVVQSPVADPLELEGHINNFLHDMGDSLAELDSGQLDRFKQSVISRILKQENSLTDRTNRYWHEIDRNYTDFDSRQQLAQEVSALNLADLMQCYSDMTERRLTVRSFGQKHLASADVKEVNRSSDAAITALKENNEFMPDA